MADQHDVLRLDIAVVDGHPGPSVELVTRLVEEIHDPRHVTEDRQQLVPWDAGEAPPACLEEPVPQRSVRQLHADDQPILGLPGPEICEKIGMPDGAEDPQVGHLAPTQAIAEPDDLERHPKAARRIGLPDVTGPARSDPGNQAIAR